MAHLVMKRPCSRCARVDEEVVSVKDVEARMKAAETASVMFSACAPGDDPKKPSMTLGYLCPTCHKIVRKYLSQAFRKLDKVSAERSSSTPDGEEIELEA